MRDGHEVYTVSADPNGAGPVFLYLHGGAFTYPITTHHWRFIGKMARQLRGTFVVPLYPLAPGSDCRRIGAFVLDVYQDLLERFDPSRVSVMGDSAGGGLVLSLAMQAVMRGLPRAAGLILISPWLDVSLCDPEQAEIEHRDPMLMRFGLRTAGRWYAGDLPPNDPLPSPLYGSLDGLPPILAFCGSRDILVTNSRRLAARARLENAELVYHEEPGLMHVYVILPLPEAEAARGRIERFVREAQTTKSRNS